MKPVKSSNITHIGYFGDKLHVTYKSGDTYVFDNVSKEQHRKLMAADSHGKYLGSMKIKGAKLVK